MFLMSPGASELQQYLGAPDRMLVSLPIKSLRRDTLLYYTPLGRTGQEGGGVMGGSVRRVALGGSVALGDFVVVPHLGLFKKPAKLKHVHQKGI